MPPQHISSCPLCSRPLSPGESVCTVCKNKILNRPSNPNVRTPLTTIVRDVLARSASARPPLVRTPLTPVIRTPPPTQPISNIRTCPACGGSGAITMTKYKMVRGPDRFVTDYVTEYGHGSMPRRVPRRRTIPGPMISTPYTVLAPCSSCGGTGKKR